MRRWMRGAAALMAAGAASAQDGGDGAIRQLEQAQADAWNVHDITGYVAPLAPDAQFVTAFGLWWKGRDEVQRKMGHAFGTLFAQSRLRLDRVEVTPLAPDVAVAHIGWTMAGARRPDGTDAGTVHGILSHTLRRTGGAWQIAAAQDTLVLGTMPEPMTAAPSADARPAPAAAPAAKPRRCLVATKSGSCVIRP